MTVDVGVHESKLLAGQQLICWSWHGMVVDFEVEVPGYVFI